MEVHIGSVRPRNLNYSFPYVRTRLVTYPVGSNCGGNHLRHLEGPITGTS